MEIKRLVVVACNHAHFGEWCKDHRIPSRDRRVRYATRARDLLGMEWPLTYTVVDWPKSGPTHVISALSAELQAFGHKVTADELAEFIASLADPAST